MRSLPANKKFFAITAAACFCVTVIVAAFLFAEKFEIAKPSVGIAQDQVMVAASGASNSASSNHLKTAGTHQIASRFSNPILSELMQSKDYASFFEKYRSAPGGDGKILAANLLDRCVNYYPNAPSLRRLRERAEQMPSNQRALASAAIDELSFRCKNFSSSHFIDRNVWVGMRRQALEANDAAGLVHHFDQPDVFNKVNVMELAQKLAQSGDPVVLDEMALFFSRSGRALVWQYDSASPPATNVEMYWAWKFASCEFSGDCGIGSSTLLDACTAGYGCEYASLEDAARATQLSPASFDRIITIKNAITSGVLNGTWPTGFWRPRKREL